MVSHRLNVSSTALILALWMAAPVFAADEEAQIPKKPTAPPPLGQKIPADGFACPRYFLYEGRKLLCDSNIGADAEKLRPIIQDVPQAIAELDTYQRNRRNLRNAAYVGTFGLTTAIVTLALTRIAKNQSELGNALAVSGLGIVGASLLYGLSLSQTNEAHIGNAVQYYNEAHPNKPIELQFSTGIIF